MATGPVEPNSERSDATASSSMDTDQSSTEVASFLSKLRSHAPSDLSRKRKISSQIFENYRGIPEHYRAII